MTKKAKPMSAHHVISSKDIVHTTMLYIALPFIYCFGLPKNHYHKIYDFRLLDQFDFYFVVVVCFEIPWTHFIPKEKKEKKS